MTHFHGLWARLVEVVVLVRELLDHVQLVSFDIALEHFRRGVKMENAVRVNGSLVVTLISGQALDHYA